MIRADHDDHGSCPGLLLFLHPKLSEQLNVTRELICPDLLTLPERSSKRKSFRGLHAVVRLQLLAWVGQPRPVHYLWYISAFMSFPRHGMSGSCSLRARRTNGCARERCTLYLSVAACRTGGMRYMRLHCGSLNLAVHGLQSVSAVAEGRFDLLQLHVLRGGAASSSKTGEDRDAASFAKTWCPTQTNCRTLSAESQETQRCAAHAAFCEREDRGSQLSICGNRLDSTVSRRRPAARPTAVTQA